MSDDVVDGVVDGVLGDPSGVKDKTFLVRVSDVERLRWHRAAEADGLKVSEWLRQLADARFREVFECSHPLQDRKVYPWSEFCLKCGVRLR